MFLFGLFVTVTDAQIQAPPNATVVGNAWYCNAGYMQVGNGCVALVVPANATVIGNAWYCNAGYKQVGNACEALVVPPNATVIGNAWYCNAGYKQVGNACVEMSPEEVRRQQEALLALALQQWLDAATVWESKIDRESGEVIMLDNGGVVKVTFGFIGFIGFRKDAVLFKSGSSWRIWIEGKRVFPCDLLKRPTENPTVADQLTIDSVGSSGEIIVTTNGAVFRVGSGQSAASLWRSGASVLLLGGSRILNPDAAEVVEVSRLR